MCPHIVKAYDQELDRLRESIVTMGDLTARQLEAAADATERADLDVASRIIEREPEADRLEHEIENTAIRVLALRQPVAIDLRRILSALRISNELERICDHAEDIARRLMSLHGETIEPVRSLGLLVRYATAMVGDAMRAYSERDVQRAKEVWDRDKILDELYSGAFRQLIIFMMEDGRRISAAAQALFVARDIERIGDRATNIAELVIYEVGGRLVEEQRPKADLTKSMTAPSTP
jgi:phosphate transport system protein